MAVSTQVHRSRQTSHSSAPSDLVHFTNQAIASASQNQALMAAAGNHTPIIINIHNTVYNAPSTHSNKNYHQNITNTTNTNNTSLVKTTSSGIGDLFQKKYGFALLAFTTCFATIYITIKTMNIALSIFGSEHLSLIFAVLFSGLVLYCGLFNMAKHLFNVTSQLTKKTIALFKEEDPSTPAKKVNSTSFTESFSLKDLIKQF